MTPTAKKIRKQWKRCGKEANINSAVQQIALERRKRAAQAARYYNELCAIHAEHQKQKNRPAERELRLSETTNNHFYYTRWRRESL